MVKKKENAKRVLSDEQLEKVTGGAFYYGAAGVYTDIKCTNQDCYMNLNVQPTAWDPIYGGTCPVCNKGTVTFTFTPYKN